jgi:hypothetical protein
VLSAAESAGSEGAVEAADASEVFFLLQVSAVSGRITKLPTELYHDAGESQNRKINLKERLSTRGRISILAGRQIPRKKRNILYFDCYVSGI